MSQPSHSPNLNISDLGLLASLKRRVWRERFGTIFDLVDGIQRLFGEYDLKILQRVWHSLFESYNQVLLWLGWNELEVDHTKSRKWQRGDILRKLVLGDRDAFKKAMDWWVDGDEQA